MGYQRWWSVRKEKQEERGKKSEDYFNFIKEQQLFFLSMTLYMN